MRGLDHHIRRARNDLYRKWAHQVCQRYRDVRVEKFSLKELSEQEKGGQLKRVEKQRAFAALSILRQYLKDQAAKARGIYDERTADQSTGQCWEHRLSLGGDRTELYLECPAGHRIDQDVNAAYNLLYNQAPAEKSAA